MNMQNRVDMAIEPKSDQINYDDFLAGEKTITVTGVKNTGNSNDPQPVNVSFEGDNGKPFKPCKSMRRVMVLVWGDPKDYVGKSMTLYGDENVVFGGKKVGGIRISHMSHIEKEINVPLTVSKTRRILFKVKPLKTTTVDTSDQSDVEALATSAANLGTDTLRKHYEGLARNEKSIVGKMLPKLKEIAAAADAEETPGFDDETGEVTEKPETSDFPGDDNYEAPEE